MALFQERAMSTRHIDMCSDQSQQITIASSHLILILTSSAICACDRCNSNVNVHACAIQVSDRLSSREGSPHAAWWAPPHRPYFHRHRLSGDATLMWVAVMWPALVGNLIVDMSLSTNKLPASLPFDPWIIFRILNAWYNIFKSDVFTFFRWLLPNM